MVLSGIRRLDTTNPKKKMKTGLSYTQGILFPGRTHVEVWWSRSKSQSLWDPGLSTTNLRKETKRRVC